MKIVPVGNENDYILPSQKMKTSKDLDDMIAGACALVAIRYFEETKKASVLFCISDKLDDSQAVYIQILFDLENDREIQFFKMHPMNINRWDKELRDKVYKPMVSEMKYGENTFLTEFKFYYVTIPANNQKYYAFDNVYYDTSTLTGYYRTILCSQGVWLQLSHMISGLTACGLIEPAMVSMLNYEKAIIHKVSSVIYNGCTDTIFMNMPVVMAHFTLYGGSILLNDSPGTGFNIPVQKEENKIYNKYIDPKVYIERYKSDEVLSFDAQFSILTPEFQYCIISTRNNRIELYTFTKEDVKRVNWGNWKKYIYINNEGENKNEVSGISL